MTPEEIERLAMRGESLPTDLNQAEQLLFMSFRCLYKSYRAGTISREQAQNEKHELLETFNEENRWIKIYQDTCKMRVELAKVSRDMVVDGCPICKRAIGIVDGRNPDK